MLKTIATSNKRLKLALSKEGMHPMETDSSLFV